MVLPAIFTRGSRYLFQNYQDAMTICRYNGFPDLFLTFACNCKWFEIDESLALIPRQKVEDRPDILVRVFRIKVRHLIDDLMKREHFGKVVAGEY